MRRRLANVSAGSGAGSEGMMTRARRRQLGFPDLLVLCAGSEAVAMRNQNNMGCCAAESGRPRKRHKARPSGEWRDWANLLPELIEDIAGRLLSADVSEYLRLRSTCKPWRQCTDDPCTCGGGLDPRFRPRDWIAVTYCASLSRLRLINVSTGARAEVDHPVLSTHHGFGVAEGLLVLCDKVTSTVRLLNPLTGTLISFPTITSIQDTQLLSYQTPRALVFKAFHRSQPRTEEDDRIVMEALKVDVLNSAAINGAGLDDSTSPPSLVLGLRFQLQCIVFAKPGHQHWVSVHNVEQSEPWFTYLDLFHSLLSFGGRCYVATAGGDVMVVDLCPQTANEPRMIYLYRETTLSRKTNSYSYLVRSHDQRMLMVRYSLRVHLDLAHYHYKPTETFRSSEGGRSRMELFEVDFTGRRLIPLNTIGGNYAAFVGTTYSVILAADKFPKLAADSVSLRYLIQKRTGLGMYHFKDRRISPPRELRSDAHGRYFPCACHWDLHDYLICDIDHAPRLRKR